MTNNPTRKPTARELVAARQRRQKDLPIESAGKKPAGKELKVVSKEPAIAAVRVDNREYRARYLDEVAPASLVGRRIKFSKDGTFVTHDDGLEVPRDAVFAALCDQTLIGWLKFNGPNEKPDTEMGLLYGGYQMPARESVGDLDRSQWKVGLNGEPEDPHQHHMYLVLQDTATLELYTFDTSSNTGRRAVGNLLRHYDRLVRTNPGEVPLVWLRTGGFEHKDPRVGFVSTPMFTPCGSRPASSTAKPDTSTAAIIDDDIDLD
jgi:hypothetical protein